MPQPHIAPAPPQSPSPRRRFAGAGDEPYLDDLLKDPLVHLILARDGLDPVEVRAWMREAGDILRKKGGPERG